MRTRALLIVVLATGACSRDQGGLRQEPLERRPGNLEAPAEQPGVGVITANELGPRRTKVIAVSSRSPEAVRHFERGRELRDNIRNEEAVAKFEKAVSLDPEFALAHAYLYATSKSAVGTEDHEQHRKRALELSIDLPQSERLLVEALVTPGSDQQADVVEQLLKVAPNDWRAYNQAAHALQRKGDLDGAFKLFSRAVELDPKAAAPYNSLAYLYAGKEQWDEALSAAATYAELMPSEPNPHDSYAELLMMTGRYQDAEQEFGRALEVSPEFLIAMDGVAVSRLYRGDFPGAIEALERAKAAAPQSKQKVNYNRKLAWAHAAAGDRSEALAAFETMAREGDQLGMKGWAAEALLNSSELLFLEGDFVAARRMAIKAVAKAKEGKPPLQQWALIQKVLAEAKLGKVSAARKSLASLEALSTGDEKQSYGMDRGLQLCRGVVALADGKPAEAVEALAKVKMSEMSMLTEGDGQYLLAQYLLWQLYDGTDEAEQAEAARQKIVGRYSRGLYHAYLRALATRE